MSFSVNGVEDMDRRMEQHLNRFNRATGQGLTDVTLDLLGRSVMLAPVDQGDLRGSGNAYIEGTEVRGAAGANPAGDTITGEVRFQTPYARRQHEELGYNHPRGGQAKYLEQPLYENEDRYYEHINRKVRESLP